VQQAQTSEACDITSPRLSDIFEVRCYGALRRTVGENITLADRTLSEDSFGVLLFKKRVPILPIESKEEKPL
jgi:hypothetical protein